MSADDQMLIIRRNDFLAKLTEDEYDALNIIHNFVVARRDDYIYFDAGFHNKLYFIKEGFVKVGNVDEDGNELVKEILQPGDVFGQFSLERSNMMGEFAKAHKQEAVLCAFTIHDFEKILSTRPDMSLAFSKKVGKKLMQTETRILNLLQKDVRSRLLYFFWTIGRQHGQHGHKKIIINNYLTHEDISRLTGTSRQSVTTMLSLFADEGLVIMDRKQIIIPDIQLLGKETKVG
jgi:CRP/FNR family cyclic AMP-dependent transcriptional regulator